MSLLDSGRDVVDIYPEVTTTDDLGNVIVVPSDTPIRRRVSIQPVHSDEMAVSGQVLTTTYRLIARDAPIGPWAKVRWVSDGGTWWDVVGSPRRYGMSPRTAHIEAVLRERSEPPTPDPDWGS